MALAMGGGGDPFSVRSINLILGSFISPLSPSRSSGRSQPFISSSSSSLVIGIVLAPFLEAWTKSLNTQKT